MATCGAHLPQSRLRFPQRSTNPNDTLSPKSGNPQPPKHEIRPLQPVGHPAIATTCNRTNIPHEDGTIRQPPQIIHGARHHLLLRYPRRLTLRGPLERFQLEMDKVLRCKLGVRPGGHEYNKPPRTRLIHGHNDPIPSRHDPPSTRGQTLAVGSDTKPPQYRTLIQSHPDTCGSSRYTSKSEGNADTLTPAKGPVELILMSNEEGNTYFST
jgi:hypothetical protein